MFAIVRRSPLFLALAGILFLAACGENAVLAPEGAPEDVLEQIRDGAPEEVIPTDPNGPVVIDGVPIWSSSVEAGVTIGSGDPDDGGGEVIEPGDGGVIPAGPPFVNVSAASKLEEGRPFTFNVQSLSLDQTTAATYEIWVIKEYTGPGSYVGRYFSGTMPNTTRTFSVSEAYAKLGTTLIWVEVTNSLGTTRVRHQVPVAPARPRFRRNTSFIKDVLVADEKTDAVIVLEKTVTPGYPDYTLPMTVDFGDGRTQTVDVDVIAAWPNAYVAVQNMSWPKPGQYTVTLQVGTSTAPAYSDTYTEVVTVGRNPAYPYIDNLQVPARVTQGEQIAWTFDAAGTGSELYTVRTTYGTNLTTTSAVAPGSTFTGYHAWDQPGDYTLTTILSNGTQADTATASVRVRAKPAEISNLVLDRNDVERGEVVNYTFRVDGPAPNPYTVTIDHGDGNRTTGTVYAGQTYSGEYAWSESGLYDLAIGVTNGVNSAAGIRPSAVTVRRPPPEIADFNFPEQVRIGEVLSYSMRFTDPTPEVTLALAIVQNGVSTSSGVQNGEVLSESGPVPEDIEPSVLDLTFILRSVQNRLLLADTIQHTITILPALPTCAVGEYLDGEVCAPAPAGSYVSEAGALAPTLCAPGTYQNLTGQTSCLPTPIGTYAGTEGAIEATPCAPGTFQNQEGQYTCYDAPPGSFVAEEGSSTYVACAAGFFQANPGATSCEPAPLGRYVATSGATSAEPCALGSYADVVGSTSCTPAPAGRYVDIVGAASATPCAPGSYQPNTGSVNCLTADPGSFVANAGSADQTACALGTYQSESGAVSCVEAPIGSYVDMIAATAPTACPTATSTLGTGSTSAAQCVSLGVVVESDVDAAIEAGTLVAAESGRNGQNAFRQWRTDLTRSLEFLEGRQRTAGCSGVRNQLAKADGDRSPKDAVAGPARAGVAAGLQRVLDEYGC